MIRHILFIFSLLAVLGFSQGAAAQDLHDLLGGEAKQEQPAPEPAPEEAAPPAEPKNYTPKQIEEQTGFADYCATDAYLSRHYDCFCMAEKYIDKRIELGEGAGSADIIAAISKECLFEQRKAVPAVPAGSTLDLSTLTDEQIADMQKFYADCDRDPFYSKSYDCECRAAKYMEKRLEYGDAMGKDAIGLELEGTCLNAAGAAGGVYDSCMNSPPNPLMKGTQEEYCECYANAFGELYGKSEGLNGRRASALKGRAQLMCMNLPIKIKPPVTDRDR